jgi:type VI secretion system protein ImpE
MTQPADLFQQGKLAEALAAQVALVRAKPTDLDARGQLVEFLVLAGELERADAQLETILAQSPAHVHGASLLRQLVRAEMARRDFFVAGRVPEFVATPSESVRLALEASIRLREGDGAAASALLAQAAEARAPRAGKLDGTAFDDLVDLDDRLGGVLEVLTPNGKYYWIEFASLQAIEFDAPARALDLAWRPARIEVRGGESGSVYVPAIYAPTDGQSEALRLGRATDWVELSPGGAVRGQGQRMWLAGDEAVAALEVGKLEFAG